MPNGLVVGCESLFVPYAPRQAGALFTAAAFGMLLGDTLTGRFVSDRWRGRLGAPLRLLLVAPYPLFALPLPPPLAVTVVAIASAGYSASLLLQERLMTLTPRVMHGQALGLHSSGMFALQGIGAAIAGAVAERTGPGVAMALLAVVSVTVTLALAPGLRPPCSPPEAGAKANASGADGVRASRHGRLLDTRRAGVRRCRAPRPRLRRRL